nr:hypothetical protein [Paenibacillus xylanexedens]
MNINQGDIYSVGFDKYLVVRDMGEVLYVLNILTNTTNKVNVVEVRTIEGQLLKVNPRMMIRIKRETLTHADKLATVDADTFKSILNSFKSTISS